MNADETLARRLGRLLERVTRQSGRLPDTPVYGSWLLGKLSESREHRRIRIQLVLTVLILVTNHLGLAVAILLVAVAFPVPSIFTDAPTWLTYAVSPIYIVLALALGTAWTTTRTVNKLRWAIEDRKPDRVDQHNTFSIPWEIAKIHLILWGIGTALLTTLYGMVDTDFIPRYLFAIGFSGLVVTTCVYLLTEYVLRPVAALALEAGPPPRRLAYGIMGRTMTVWLLGSGVPLLGIFLAALFVLVLHNMSRTQFAVAILILTAVSAVFGFVLMYLKAWLIATPVRVVRAALKRVEQGDLDFDLAVFDGTELGELQRGFNAMVAGLREREKVRDLFGRHVGREVAAAAETEHVQLGGDERHVAVIFVDVIGSSKLVSRLAAWEVVTLLNRFFSVAVSEVEERGGLLNKFEGDGCLAIFGAPNDLDHPEDAALATARAIAERMRVEVPECEAGIGVAAGEVVAGYVGARERFEYTVIGTPVNEAARLCELAKQVPGRVLASSDTVQGATEAERACWTFGEPVTLRGLESPTLLATPIYR